MTGLIGTERTSYCWTEMVNGLIIVGHRCKWTGYSWAEMENGLVIVEPGVGIGLVTMKQRGLVIVEQRW